MTAPGGGSGRHNDLTDVRGLRVGHHTARGSGALTGCTVVLAPDGGMAAGVDVRGGAPGTRETDLLHPTASVQRVHAVLLTGGSAFGLAVADGVMAELEDRGIGYPVGPAVVPLVPTAVLFDLGRGGEPRRRPGADAGRDAVRTAGAGPIALGAVGAGTGAACAGLKGGVGSASWVLPDGHTVAALVAVNAAGSAVDPRSGRLWAETLLRPEDGDVPVPTEEGRTELAALLRSQDPRLRSRGADPALDHTTLAVVATDAPLTKVQCTKLASLGQDGLARALNPVHTAFDGDTVFAVATGQGGPLDDLAFHDLVTAGAEVTARAVMRAMLAAPTVRTDAGTWPGYRDLVAG